MDSSDLYHHHHHHHYNHHQHQHQLQQPPPATTSGLTRYRSAPSSYFSDLINNSLFADDDNDPFANSKVSKDEADQILSRFTASLASAVTGGDDIVKQEPVVYNNNNNNQNQFRPQMDNNNNNNNNNQAVSTGMDVLSIPGNGNSLRRQNSSPAGFIAHLASNNNNNINNGGYPMMRSMNAPSSMLTSSKRMKNEMGFSSGSQLPSGMLPRIPENESKMEMKSTRNDGGFGSWDDSDMLSDSFLKDFGEIDQSNVPSMNAPNNQLNDVGRIRPPTTLVSHLSLPASTAELDKLMQFQDSVPLRSRAKRGCATHPRSIAERVRRTRISERMRKLQDLVPNMDKQTNTADMLDLAVDYIKELQKEAETLSDRRAKCTCPHKREL